MKEGKEIHQFDAVIPFPVEEQKIKGELGFYVVE